MLCCSVAIIHADFFARIYSTDGALLVVLWRLRYKLSLHDLAEMVLTRGFTVIHEMVREWEERFAPLLTERLRAKRRGTAGVRRHADETYITVDGRWCYLYRAIDADGTLVDSTLSEARDMGVVKRFFTRARTVVGHAPETVTTDEHDAYPRAVRETPGPDVQHHTSWYMHSRMEQDHRGMKRRYYPMRGVGSLDAADRFCSAHDERRDHLRYRQRTHEAVSLPDQPLLLVEQWGEVCAVREAASARSALGNDGLRDATCMRSASRRIRRTMPQRVGQGVDEGGQYQRDVLRLHEAGQRAGRADLLLMHPALGIPARHMQLDRGGVRAGPGHRIADGHHDRSA